MKLTFRLKLLLSHAIIALVAAFVAAATIEASIGSELEKQIDTRLQTQAEAVSRWLSERSEAGRTESESHYERLSSRLSAVVDAEVTILTSSGRIVAHTGAIAPGEDSERTEVLALKNRTVGKATRNGKRYLAVRTDNDYIARLAVPTASISETRKELRVKLFFAAAVALLVAISLGGFLARTLSGRLQNLRNIAERVGKGDYLIPHEKHSDDEFGVLSRALTMSADKLATLDSMRRDFLANAAHELRTPVTSIRGYADTLINSEVDDATRREFLQTIHRNSLRISALVDELLQLQSLEDRDDVGREIVPVNISAVLNEVKATAGALATEHDATLYFECPDNLRLLADVDELEQVILNLVVNAIKHAGSSPKVWVSAVEAGGNVQVSVSDDGDGIPEEALPRIFERFFRVDPGRTRHQGGSGLGLAIVKELTEAMGGTVTVGAAAEGGALFTVYFPSAPSQNPPQA